MCVPQCGGRGYVAHRSCPHGGWIDLGWAWVSSVSPLDMQRKTTTESYKTACIRASTWVVKSSRVLLSRTEIDICSFTEQTGFHYTIYKSSVFLLSLHGPAVIVPDVVAPNSRSRGGKLHGGISLILTFSKSMKSGAWPAGPGY